MTKDIIQSAPTRNYIIQEIYLDGYSNDEIYQFMNERQLSIRHLQYISSNLNWENTPKYTRNRIIFDIHADGISIIEIHRFMALSPLSLRSIQIITKRVFNGEL
jgi:hypothetical protein